MMTLPLATISTFFSAFHQSDGFGKSIFFGLFLLSCITWVVLIQKIWTFRQIRKETREFDEVVQRQSEWILNISKDSLPVGQGKECPHPFANIFFAIKKKTLEILDKNHKYGKQLLEGEESPIFLSSSDMELVASHLDMAIAKEVKALEKNLFVLSTIVTLAPFLGLLGTVWGILVSFSQLQTGASSQSSSLILGGLSTALTTTVLGLLIAIPALIGYNYLKNGVKSLLGEMDTFSSNVLSTIELQYRRVDVK